MNQVHNNSGALITRKQTGPAIEVDCSGWCGEGDGEWTRGEFVSRKQTRAAVEFIFTAPGLQLQVSGRPGVSV